MTQQFDLIRARESAEGWKVASNDRPPGSLEMFRPAAAGVVASSKTKSHADDL
jgi:hypothetical protein